MAERPDRLVLVIAGADHRYHEMRLAAGAESRHRGVCGATGPATSVVTVRSLGGRRWVPCLDCAAALGLARSPFHPGALSRTA
jgi:hypothetical protein